MKKQKFSCADKKEISFLYGKSIDHYSLIEKLRIVCNFIKKCAEVTRRDDQKGKGSDTESEEKCPSHQYVTYILGKKGEA